MKKHFREKELDRAAKVKSKITKSVKTKIGVIVNHWELTKLTLDVIEGEAFITIQAYVSKEEMDAGAAPVDIRNFICEMDRSGKWVFDEKALSNKTYEEVALEYIKREHPEFSGGVIE